MANKRVSELSPIFHTELAVDDLFLLADISAIESKKLSVSEMSLYLQTVISASATSSWAGNALTASYILYQGFPNGTASCALISSFNISSSYAITASYAMSASYVKSASYALSSSHAITASYAYTSSVQLMYSSAYATYAKTASYLLYLGTPNGTASYAILANLANSSKTASYLYFDGVHSNGTVTNALNAIIANTASYLLYSGTPNGTASYALRSNLAVIADGALTSSFLYYDGLTPNGTASYAINSTYALTASYLNTTSLAQTYKIYGPYPATMTGNDTASFLIGVTASINLSSPMLYVEFEGNQEVDFTGSVASYFIMVSHVITGVPLAPQYMIGGSNYDLTPIPNNNYNSKFSIINSNITASIVRDFIIRGSGDFATGNSFYILLYAYGAKFNTSTRPVTFWVHSKFDDINLTY